MSFKNPIDPYPSKMNTTTPPVSNSGTSSLSPAFFAIAIAGSIAFLFLVTSVVIILRKFGYCFCPEPLPNPEDDDEHVPVPVARQPGLSVGLINSFPVCMYGSPECEQLMAKGRGGKKRGQNGAEEKALLGKGVGVWDGGDSGNAGGASLKRDEGETAEGARESVVVAVSSGTPDGGTVGGSLLNEECGDDGKITTDAVAAADACSSGRHLVVEAETAGPLEGDSVTVAAQGFTGGDIRVGVREEGTAVREAAGAAETDALRAASTPAGGITAAAGRGSSDGVETTNATSAPADETLIVDEGKECSVCLSDFQAGEPVKILPPCGHAFHVQCISEWLAAKDTCPLCRCCLAPRQRQMVVVRRRRREEPFFWP